MDAAAVNFFVSRRGCDAAHATQIAAWLEGAGHRVLIQDWDFRDGTAPFLAQIHEGLASGARLVVCLSEDWDRSDWCLKELTTILAQEGDPLNRKGKVVVFRINLARHAGFSQTFLSLIL